MNNKRKQADKAIRLVIPPPAIAAPNDQEKYERQICFVTDWFFEMLDRVGGGDVKAAHAARDELPTLFLKLLSKLLKLALNNKESSAKRWAGELLASTFVSVDKHHEKLWKRNAAYLKEKKKLGKLRPELLFPKSVGRIVQRELKTAERYQFKLRLLCDQLKTESRLRVSVDKKAVERRLQDELVWQHLGASSDALWTPEGIREIEKRARAGAADPGRIYPDEVSEKRRATWQDLAEHSWKIPKEYWPAAHLRPFSVKSEPKWWESLWPLIRKKINVAKLDLRYQMARKRFASDSAKTARDHLKLLARQRDEGVLL